MNWAESLSDTYDCIKKERMIFHLKAWFKSNHTLAETYQEFGAGSVDATLYMCREGLLQRYPSEDGEQFIITEAKQ